MSRLAYRLRALAALGAGLTLPTLTWAAGGGGAERIVFVADSRTHSGMWSWFSNLYNDSTILFTLVTVITIPVTGVLLGLMADFVMSRTGIDLKSRTTGEH